MTEQLTQDEAGTLTLGGTAYRIAPLDDADNEELCRLAQDFYLDQAIALAERRTDLSEEHRELIVGEGTRLACHCRPGSPVVDKFCLEIDGLIATTWLSLRHHHPELTRGAVHEMLLAERDALVKNGIAEVVTEQPASGG